MKLNLKVFFIASLLLFCTGCITQQRKSQQELSRLYIQECSYNDPALDPIRNKVAFLYTGIEQTKDMKSNTSYPTDAERNVIALWVKKRNTCNKTEYNLLLLKNKKVVDNFIGLLYNQKITYGMFANYREDVARLTLDVEQVEAAVRRHCRQ